MASRGGGAPDAGGVSGLRCRVMGTAEHTIDTSDGTMRLYEATPDVDPEGAVIVIMEAFGVNDHIEDVTRRFAAAGFHAIAPDLFHRAGGGVAAYDDFGTVMEKFKSVSDDGILVDVDATIAHLRSAGFTDEQIGIVGFCFGGRVTFLTAARRKLGAAVTFYGGGIVSAGALPFPSLFDEAKDLKTPWLGLFGDKDQGIPVEDVERLREELDRTNPVPHEIIRYPDADHGFHCDGRPAVFNEAAASDAFSRAVAWFNEHL
jgi:carboxymethylenebutenolidase